jgi:hypothetical protein
VCTTWLWQDTTIPVGFIIEAPTTGGVQIVRTDFWNDTVYVGNVIIKANMANPSSQVAVTANVLGDTATTTQAITYAPGATFIIKSPFVGGASMLAVRWPTATEEGYANVSVPGLPLQNITDVYTMQNPDTPGTFYFHATTEGDPVSNVDSVVLSVSVPVYNTLGLAALVGIQSVVLGFATSRGKKYSK